ncbi:MAG TPA: hypothetical protein VFV37_10480 [Luteibaculaceae bacterium]|nr:hypothetical protein [Luteibaculaceae bacterium]
MSDIKYISNRISFTRKNGHLSVVIAATVSRTRESLLVAWLAGWTFCGAYFIYALFGDLPREHKLFIAVLLSFWLYYEYRIGKMVLWRKFGYESLRIQEGKMILREVIKGMGKPKEYLLGNIRSFGVLPIENGWMKTMDQSFWVMGTGRLQFEYLGKLICFGRQLTDEEIKRLQLLLGDEIKKEQRR